MRLFAKSARARLMISAAAGAIALGSGSALAQTKTQIELEAQPLASALYEFGRQTGHQVIFSPSLTQSKMAPSVTGADEQTAMTQLLAGTGLTFRREGNTFMVMQAGEGGSGPQDQSAGDVDALIVTAQKKEEAIQDVPIAISAFTQKSLDAQKIEGGFDLLKAIPNVTFSKNNFTGYNFSIRGVGTKAVSASTDPAVAVSFNNVALIQNRLFEQEYFDVERVEVLRGPQGTLYGRNATSGVINVISAKPRLGDFEADVKAEVGNYDARRLRGMVNVPIGDALALRVAGAWTQRSGYGVNLYNGADVDGRDLWSMRASLAFEPVERIRANLLWEHFEEDDNRVRTSKQLCHRDPGPTSVGGYDISDDSIPAQRRRNYLSQGCQPGSLYADEAFGTPNGEALPYVLGLESITLGYPQDWEAACAEFFIQALPVRNRCQLDPYGGLTQPRDLRSIYSQLEPVYRASADLFELNIDIDLTDALTFTSQTAYNRDKSYATQDINRFRTFPLFNDSQTACATFQIEDLFPCDPGQFEGGEVADVTPGGIYTDPQLGPSNGVVGMDLAQADGTQFTQEVRLQSSFDGPVNFSVGANYTYFRTEIDYYVFINTLSMIADAYYNRQASSCNGDRASIGCIYIDPNPLDSINGEGHNYFRSKNPYKLNSLAAFGEAYWEIRDNLRVTAGVRWTSDRKVFTPYPSQTMLLDYRITLPEYGEAGLGGNCSAEEIEAGLGNGLCMQYGASSRGYQPQADIVQEWREPTGRLVVDWRPDLGFTDETMLFLSLAHGYKGGGANPPGIAEPAGSYIEKVTGTAEAPRIFAPEFVDAIEVGAKNTLLGGGLILNLGAFYYDYEGYQVSKISKRMAVNENFDAKVWGAEMEWIFSPTRNLRFNGAVGYLHTEIADGMRSIDLMDRTQGGNQSYAASDGTVYDDWVLIRGHLFNSASCIAPAELVGLVLAANPAQPFTNDLPQTFLWMLCPGGNPGGQSYTPGSMGPIPDSGGRFYNPSVDAPNGGAGFYADLGGNELPNAPQWTLSFGAQYSMELPGGWRGTGRLDYYRQDKSFARVYNTEYDRLKAWENVNLSLWLENADWGLTAEVYVKNATDEMPITDAFLNSDDLSLTTNVFTLDPRLVGVSLRKSF